MTDNRKRLVFGTAVVTLAVGLAAVLASGDEGGTAAPSATGTIPQATPAELAAAGLDEFPLARPDERVDLTMPTFSSPTKVTNPLFPISNLQSAILSGTVEGKDFKTETTLLPETEFLVGPSGRPVETLVSQYVAYLDGRIEEVALDHYAQADDGSVWYFGEDVFNYDDGVVGDTAGTWFAGIDGPAAMIMPGDPQVGDVYRSENIPGVVFEEVRIKSVDKTVQGPHGPVSGAVIAAELHADGAREDKTFAPGYGEFFTGGGGDAEAMSLAVPADELAGPPPPELLALSAGADAVFDQAAGMNWGRARATVRSMNRSWQAFRAGQVPARLEARMSRALAGLTDAVAGRDSRAAQPAAIDVAQNGLDLQLRHRPQAEIDRGRFELWARRLVVDAKAEDAPGIRGDLATLEWVRDRFVHTLAKADAVRIDQHLLELRSKVDDDDLAGAGAEAERLRETLAGL
jgi:hypothetical protein